MASQHDHISQFIHHAKMVHRQEFPHENPVNMNNPSEQAERYFWLIGFLNHCAETFNADAIPHPAPEQNLHHVQPVLSGQAENRREQ